MVLAVFSPSLAAPRRAASLALGLALAFGASGPSAAAEIETRSEVASVLVYPSGARVTREARFAAPAGRHEILVADLPAGLDEASLRVSGETRGEGAFEILGVAYRRLTPRVEPLSEPARQALLERIEAKSWELREAEDAVAEALARVEYIQAFRAATVGRWPYVARGGGRGEERAQAGPGRGHGGGRGPGLFSESESWSEGWALIAAESATARDALRGAERLRDGVAEELDALRDELDQTGPTPPARNLLTVSIAASAPVEAGALAVEYLAGGARWEPLYDLKLDTAHPSEPGLKATLALSRMAAVTQATGEDWRGVALSLSTAQPSGRVAARPPRGQQAVLAPLRLPRGLAPSEPAAESSLAGDQLRSTFNRAEELSAQVLSAQAAPAPQRAPAPVASALAAVSGAGVVYEIQEPADVPGDGARRQVLIGVETAEVDLVARATPSLDKAAYLYALRANGEAPLLPGRAAIYRDGVFHGQFDLAFVAPGAESALPFGRLDDVTVNRVTRTKTTGEEGLFSTSNREQSRFELTARNGGDIARRITLLDSMPFSETEDIEIAFVGRAAPTDRDIEGRRGVIGWTFTLAPGAERKIAFGYDVSWPEGRDMRIQPTR